MLAARLALAAAVLSLALPVRAEPSPFEGVWQVTPMRPPGARPPGGGPPGPAGGPRRGAGPNADGSISLGAPPPEEEAPDPNALDSKVSGPKLPANLSAMLDRGDRHTWSQMTDAGQAMFTTFDPKKLPANNCKSPGLPSIAMTPNLQEWTMSGGKLSIHHENFDTRRDIALDTGARAAGPHTNLGHAVAKIDGARLTIETTGFTAAWSGLGRNAPSSDAKIVRETYQLEGPDTLRGQIEVEDAKFLKSPLRMRVLLHRAPAGTKIESFPCDLEASKRDLGD
jgi:hypothetical protein